MFALSKCEAKQSNLKQSYIKLRYKCTVQENKEIVLCYPSVTHV